MIRLLLVFNICISATAMKGWIHGKVIDVNGAVIPGVRIYVESRDGLCQVTSDAEGRFTCSVESGMHTVSASGNTIRPYRRSQLRVEEGHHLYVLLRCLPPPFPQRDRTKPVDTQFEEISDGGAIGLVNFTSSTKDGSVIKYQGDFVTLVAGAAAIMAKEIECSNQNVCKASGQIKVDIGLEELEATMVEIDLARRTITIARKPVIVKSF